MDLRSVRPGVRCCCRPAGVRATAGANGGGPGPEVIWFDALRPEFGAGVAALLHVQRV